MSESAALIVTWSGCEVERSRDSVCIKCIQCRAFLHIECKYLDGGTERKGRRERERESVWLDLQECLSVYIHMVHSVVSSTQIYL